MNQNINIDAKKVMKLRSITGAGMMDCKRALQDCQGKLDDAKDYLRKKRLAAFRSGSDRKTEEGGVAIALLPDGKTGGIVQLGCQTDFVARNDEFVGLLDTLAQQALQTTADFSNQPSPDGDGDVKAYLARAAYKLGENVKLVDVKQVNAADNEVVEAYLHTNRRVGVLVTLSTESDTSTNGSTDGSTSTNNASTSTNNASTSTDKQIDWQALRNAGRDLAMHIAASAVIAIHPDQVDKNILAKEREVFSAQVAESGKPPEIVEKMIEGRLNKFVKEVALLAQPFVKDAQLSIEQWLSAISEQLGASVKIKEFVKLQV